MNSIFYFSSPVDNGGINPLRNDEISQSQLTPNANPDKQNFSINQNNQNPNNVKYTQMNAIRDAEHQNASSQQVINRINKGSKSIHSSVLGLQKLTQSNAASQVKEPEIAKSLYGKANKLYENSKTAANVYGVKVDHPNIGDVGFKKVMGIVTSAQKNYNNATLKLASGHNLSVGNLMTLSTKLNQANVGMQEILTVARQLVDSVNKLSNAQI